jgi:hypothetical protein
MADKHDLRRLALALDGVTASPRDDYAFDRDGRGMAWPFPERVHPRKARVPNYSMYCMRVADADDKEALLAGEPDIYFTTDHYTGYAAVIVRLDAISLKRLAEAVQMAWEAAPMSQRLSRKV